METLKPKSISLLYVLFNLRKALSKSPEFIRDLLLQHGGLIQIKAPGLGKLIITDRPDLIKGVLQKEYKRMPRTRKFMQLMQRQFGPGILTTEGEYWLQQKRLMKPMFSHEHLPQLYNTVLGEVTTFCDQLTGPNIELRTASFDLTFDITMRIAANDPEFDVDLRRFRANSTISQMLVAKMVRMPLLQPLYQLSGKFKTLQRLKDENDAIINRMIAKRKTEDQSGPDFLSQLMSARYEDGSGMNDAQLLSEMKILFNTSHETTALVLNFALFKLVEEKGVQQKLLNEIRSVVGDGPVQMEHLPALKYCKMVIQETMRMFPPAWILDRSPKEDINVNGLAIKADQPLLCAVHAVHHHPDHWEAPETFHPERFEDPQTNQQTFTYLPFGAGPRQCIGSHLSMMILQTTIAEIVRRFELGVVAGNTREVSTLHTLQPKGKMVVKFLKRGVA